MRIRRVVFAWALALVCWPDVGKAQGPSAPRFESLTLARFECAPPSCSGLEIEHRQSRLGRSVLIGALIGAAIGGLGVLTAYGLCEYDDCPGRAVLAVSFSAGVGAMVGLIVGASEPSRGPVPTD